MQKAVKNLCACYLQYEQKSESIKNNVLDELCGKSISFSASELKALYGALLFMAAHPQSVKQLQKIKLTFKNLAEPTLKLAKKLPDSGLPYSTITTRYSHDMLQWLLNYNECTVALDALDETAEDLNALLKQTLPKTLLDFTTIGYNSTELLEALQVDKKEALPFLINQFNALNGLPYSKDYAWEKLNAWINVTGKHFNFSLPGNTFLSGKVYYHNNLMRHVDANEIVQSPLPEPTKLSPKQLKACVATIKKSLVLTMRETDPVTYLCEPTLRYYELERGVAIAIYGMNGFRQQPLNSYIGYTLFKNGFPAAYGGAWVFGQSAQFGLNIFEHFRGGESAYLLCSLLRVYKQVFQLNEIEIDAYQFGKDNAEGIASGAFWFYYKLGFRPIALKQQKLAANEYKKIQTQQGYRSKASTLITLAESNMVLQFNKVMHPGNVWVQQSMQQILLANKHKFWLNFKQEVLTFKNLAGLTATTIENEVHLTEVALMFKVLKLNPANYQNLAQMLVQNKTNNPYLYNSALTELLLRNKV